MCFGRKCPQSPRDMYCCTPPVSGTGKGGLSRAYTNAMSTAETSLSSTVGSHATSTADTYWTSTADTHTYCPCHAMASVTCAVDTCGTRPPGTVRRIGGSRTLVPVGIHEYGNQHDGREGAQMFLVLSGREGKRLSPRGPWRWFPGVGSLEGMGS